MTCGMPSPALFRFALSSTNGSALTPPELVNAHLHADSRLVQALRKEKAPVVPA
jgi:hypothetical protein